MMPENKDQYRIPTDRDKLLVWLEKQRDEAQALPEMESKRNLNFVLGRTFGVWNKERRRFDQPRSHRGDPNAPVRVSVNKIAGIVERVIARLTKSAPIPECRPVTDTETDVDSARVGTRILDHELTRLAWQQRLLELYFWVLPLGCSYFHVRWDPDAGPEVGEDPESGEPLAQGDIVLDEVPAFELVLDPNARRFRDARWCIRTVAMTKEAVYEQYGRIPDAEAAESLHDEWRATSAESLDGSGGSGSSKGKGCFVAVHQFWLRPGGRERPEGLVVTWSGKTLLEDPKPFPYEHGRLPFVPFNLLPALGSGAFGRTWVSDLVPMQVDYDDARSREAAIRRVMTPKLLAARGQIDPNRMTARVEVIDYNPTGPDPKWLMPDGRWMSQFEQAMNRADQEMGDRSGQAEVSQGRAASSAPAASILALQEADETKLAVSAKELAFSVQDLGWQTLMLVRQFWTEERMVRTWSRDGELEVSRFSGSDLAEQLDVHVSTESALPRSKSARVQLAIDLWSQQIISDPRHFVRMLDLPGTDFLMETLNLDAKQAEREIHHLNLMEPVEVKPWHVHEAHAATHMEYMKTEEFEALSPEAQAWHEGHLAVHQGIIQQKLMAAAGMAAAGGPVPGQEPGGPGGPQPQTTNPGGQNGEYTNPLTGRPQDPLQVAAGLAPSALQGALNQGVVGGTGNPGSVPGHSDDTVAMRTGN